MATRKKKAARRNTSRLPVAKTYKLYVGGQFIRSESGKVLKQVDAQGNFMANTVRASRKDLRGAVLAARKVQEKWAGSSAFLRSQILYRAAEVLEDRRTQFEAALTQVAGLEPEAARQDVSASIDRLFWYAGWCDKFSQVLGSVNPVASSYFNFSVPEPVGVVAVLASQKSPLLGLVSGIAPVILTGNTCVVVIDHPWPTIAVDFAEVLACSDLPGGVVNLLTGHRGELQEIAAGHRDINALVSFGGSASERTSLGELAAEHVKRVHFLDDLSAARWREPAGQSLYWVDRFVEWKTAWHPIGV